MENFDNEGKPVNDDIRAAYEARMRAIDALRALDAEIGDKPMSEEQRSQVEAINADVDVQDERIARGFRKQDLDAHSAKLDAIVGVQVDAGQRSDDGLTPIEREARVLLLGKDHPESRSSVQFDLAPGDMSTIARRDILAGTAGDGAEMIPTSLFGQLYVQLREGATSMFSLGRDVVTAGGEAVTFPTVTSFSAASLIAEAGSVGESDPQFATVTLDAYKYGLSIQVSSEFQADNAVPGAIPFIVDQAVQGMRRGIGAHLIAGTGSSQPNGVVNGSTTSTVAGIVAPTADALISITHDVASPYRSNAVWLFNDATVATLRLLKDTTNQYIWQPGMTAGSPNTLLGAPVYTDSSIAVVGANAKCGVYGDLKSGYLVRTVGGVRADMSPDYAFLNDLITWRFLMRADGDIIDNNAFTVLTNEAS
tara:strand:- start:1775 stop:3040 length:1266 start_codon:yes stop_codon:yes gene_type:complete